MTARRLGPVSSGQPGPVSSGLPGPIAPIAPIDYPGPMQTGSVLLIESDRVLGLTMTSRRLGDARVGPAGSSRSLSAELAARGAAPLEQRHLVLAIGSNAVASVLGAKLSNAGVSPVVAMVSCAVGGIEIGHSAHVSAAGYIAAAPLRAPGSSTGGLSALLLEQSQRSALDRTEPNYDRHRLLRTEYPIRLDGAVSIAGFDAAGFDAAGFDAAGFDAAGFDVYVSRWGVLTDASGRPIRRTTQTDLIAQLRALDAELAAQLPADPSATTRYLSRPGVAAAITGRFAAAGWARPSGLDLGPPPDERDTPDLA